MNSGKMALNTEESESDFVRLLRRIQENKASSETLLEHPIFKARLRLITMTLAETTEDAEELANDVRLKVWKRLHQFQPDYAQPYGYFFAWLRNLTRSIHIDLEASVLYKEVMVEFEKSINALPERERLAMAFYLQGFSFREISEKMLQAGFSSSHVMVARWIRDGLRAFFERADFKKIRSRNARVTRVRATRAKRELQSILEQAINSRPPSIATEVIDRKPLAVSGRHQPSKPTQLSSSLDRISANELLESMQSAESKRGIQAAFDASPDELGWAAVEQANRARKVTIDSLTTFLMAASTVNVVGRVMNLTNDAA